MDSQEDKIDPERQAIRDEVSKMSIEEILELKEKIGSKMFDKELGFSKPSTSKDKFRRENKNRPRMEPISKRPMRKKPIDNIPVKPSNKKEIRDPRFDSMCGEFDEKIFKASYKFVDDIKSKELVELKKQLKDEEDPEKVSQLKYLIQRMENQAREKTKISKQKEAAKEEKQKNRELAREGKAPVFVSKAERKNKELVDKFEELKSSGKIDSYLKKKAKKNETKDRIKMSKMKSNKS